MVNPGCRWVRDRLPLLAGDELWGSDRQRVERHLIGCPGCRGRLASLDRSLTALQAAAAEAPTTPDAPSLWPALATQIREARRPAPLPTSRLPLALLLDAFRIRFWPALGLSLLLLATLGATAATYRRTAALREETTVKARPIGPKMAVPIELPAPALAATPAPPPAESTLPAETPVVENTPAPTRLDYDLDHGTPMGPDSRDAKPAAY